MKGLLEADDCREVGRSVDEVSFYRHKRWNGRKIGCENGMRLKDI